MKKLFSILSVAALFLGISACVPVPEDAFSTDPVAPEFYTHNDILMTSNTMEEDVTFSWTAYRFLEDGLSYDLTATYEGTSVSIAKTTEKNYTTSKTSFKNALYNAFPNLPINDTFPITFTVSVTDNGKTFSSRSLTLNIYAYGDAIASVVTPISSSFILDPEDPQGKIDVATWTPARLVYGEPITYNVFVEVGDGIPYQVAEGLTDLVYTTTVDALNEAVIAAGGAEAAEVPVMIVVKAVCPSIPEGIASVGGETSVTTYLATFPDNLYLPGSYQGWNPAEAPTIPQSSVQKGYFEGIVDLRTEDGSDCQFKFSPVPAWENDFGGVVTVEAVTDGDGYNVATGTVGVSDNIVVPSGIYDIVVNKKLNKITMVEVKAITMIGAACGDYGWGQDVEMEFNLDAKMFTATTTLKPGEYKFRLNHDWKYSIGKSLGVTLSDGNLTNENEGDYKVVLNASTCPFTVKYINTSFPDEVYVPGSHNGWSFDHTPLAGDGEGHYEGFMDLGGEWGFKLTPVPNWDSTQWGLDNSVEPTVNEKGGTVYGIVAGGGNIMEATDGSYHKLVVDLSEMTVTVYPIESVSIIGGFNGWASDYAELTYDANADSWKAENVLIPDRKTEWKFRMNHDWFVNLGGPVDNLEQDGSNITYEAGVYTVELFIHTTPYHAVLTKTGEVDGPTLPETMYMIGSGVGGWDWTTNAVTMVPVHSHPGCFWAIRYIEAGSDNGFKFSPEPAWSGKDFFSLGENDSGFQTKDGNCYVEESGLYIIGIDYGGEKIVVEPANVYGIGPCYSDDSWGGNVAFTKNADGTVTSPVLKAGNIRMYTVSSCFTDVAWWQMEFVFYDGQIAYRGDGGDQAAVPMADGQKVTLNFNEGTAVVE